ncbi:MAG: response regulator transcription factor [Taibaiella sp.]|jgi:DNA-binding NarL/FixJ family response regulator
MMTIRVTITDDHPLVITGLSQTLESIPGVSVSGVYTSGQATLDGIVGQPPDIMLLDLQLPDMSGRQIAQKVLKQYPDTRVLILSAVEDDVYVAEMMEMGCSGYLPKSLADRAILQRALETVYYGDIYMQEDQKKYMLTAILKKRKKSANTASLLTRKEKEIMGHILNGLSSSKIAEQLQISVRTVETHRFSLMQKLDVKNAAELVRKVMELHLLQ